jgi:NADP-dependent 3-hydroxy acid dehydrogenase YdfG
MQDVILITGASSGIGKSIAEYLVKFNYKVYGTSRNPKQDLINGVRFLQLDVTQQQSVLSAKRRSN